MRVTTMTIKLLTATGLTLILGACASIPHPNAALDNARIAVQTAEADPLVNQYAALDLDVARKDLSNAEYAALHHQDGDVAQSAYLATQNARLAQAHATVKAEDARVAAGQAERDQIMLAARTREADNAKAAAANAEQVADSALTQRDQANEEAARAQAELDALKATPSPRGMVLTLGDLLFDTGRAELKPGAGRKIDQLGQFLVEHPDRRVQIDGFTDSVGSDSYNLDLSQRRADAVKKALIERGVDGSRIGTEGYGKSYPVAGNSDSGGRQLNRRVEVVIGSNDGTQIAARAGGGAPIEPPIVVRQEIGRSIGRAVGAHHARRCADDEAAADGNCANALDCGSQRRTGARREIRERDNARPRTTRGRIGDCAGVGASRFR
jgi:outer membrane protein OmpA-like peptidoglycan-associated protein